MHTSFADQLAGLDVAEHDDEIAGEHLELGDALAERGRFGTQVLLMRLAAFDRRQHRIAHRHQ